MAKSTRTPAKKAGTQKPAKKNSGLDVSFESDIPKISREGTERKSKYDTLLDKVRGVAEKDSDKCTAVLQFDASGKATSRYTSIKDAVAKREDADHWTVAVRTHADDDVRLYVKWNEDAQVEEPEEEEEEEEEEDDDF
jgi:hypothetical protein